jgi:ABC-type oligopeptide transport system substrate-binding subunit
MNLHGLFNYALIAATTIVVASCNPSPESVGGLQDTSKQRILRRGNGGEPHSLDPAIAEDAHAFSVLGDLYEGLISRTVGRESGWPSIHVLSASKRKLVER